MNYLRSLLLLLIMCSLVSRNTLGLRSPDCRKSAFYFLSTTLFSSKRPTGLLIYRMLFNVNGQETFILTTELPTHVVSQSFLIHVSITHILILLRILLAAFLPLQSKLMIIIHSWLIFMLQTLTLTAGNFFFFGTFFLFPLSHCYRWRL